VNGAIAIPIPSRPGRLIDLISVVLLGALLGTWMVGIASTGRFAGISSRSTSSEQLRSSSFCPLSSYSDNTGLHTPDETCTGYGPTGVTLTTWGGSCTLSSGTYDSLKFNCDPLNINANNITIKRSWVNGGGINDTANHIGLVVEDTLIDCGSQAIQAIGHSDTQGTTDAGFTARRVHARNCAWAFYAGQMIVEDSFCEELFGFPTGNPEDPESHNECVLGAGPGPHYFDRNTLEATLSAASGGHGAVSACFAFYTHGTFWEDIDNVIYKRNRCNSQDANVGGYLGEDQTGTTNDITNASYTDNVWGTGQAYGTTYTSNHNLSLPNCFGPGNRTSAGTPITANGMSECP
jgi:hypothetical protein